MFRGLLGGSALMTQPAGAVPTTQGVTTTPPSVSTAQQHEFDMLASGEQQAQAWALSRSLLPRLLLTLYLVIPQLSPLFSGFWGGC